MHSVLLGIHHSGNVAETRSKQSSIEGSSMPARLLQLQRQQCNRTKANATRIFAQSYASFMKHTQHSGNNPSMKCQCQAMSSLARLQRPPQIWDEYRIYQPSVDLDVFFAKAQQYEKVSDICLLNDNFMLVKMPEPALSATTTLPTSNSKLSRCFQCNRRSRVSPVAEETLDKQNSKQQLCLVANTWTLCDDVEVFESRTRIIPVSAQAVPPNERVACSSRPVIVQQPKRQSEKLETTPTQSMELQLEAQQTLPPPPPADLQPQSIRRSTFDWLLWPFRWRAKQKPNAAVHKTYFVRWTKPPDTLWHGYGVERSAAPDKMQLRRCRSAVF